MMMYLLLRNNKQSGPYSLDDLKTMGLKAYDLVWVEGKSAAWRYPCEIDELSAFAPAVEEQPFDRFFKKASPAKANTTSSVVSGNSSVVSDPPKLAGEPSIYEPQKSEPSTVPGKRIIYVTMPSAKGQQSPAPVGNNWSSRPEPAVVTPAPAPVIHKSVTTPIEYEFEDNPAQGQTDETPFVEFLPRPEKRRSNPILMPLLVGLALLAAGIFIGLSINKDTISLPPKSKLSSANPVPNVSASSRDNGRTDPTTAQQLPVPVVNNDQQPKDQKPDPAASAIGQTNPLKPIGQTIASEPVARQAAETRSSVNMPGVDRSGVDRSDKAATQKARPANANARSQALSASTSPSRGKDSALGAVPIVNREATHRADAGEKPDAGADKEASAKANIASQVSVGANGYTVGTFGGINDLQVTVSNRSAYPLDLVVVEVQYIQANKKIYKTENLYFRGIGAGSALMQEAPKSSRGIKVSYKITMINSKELGLSYSGI
ncbi:MAG TPA: hypothetical protein VL727_22640 [Puia sp.]|nr:hypothetical protein [Puia sp.]